MRLHSILTGVLIACIVLLVISIVQNSFQMVKARQRLLAGQEKVDKLERQQQGLLYEREYRNSQSYLEQQIRDKLKLVKPGETMLVLPSQIQERSEENIYKYQAAENAVVSTPSPWSEWKDLFW